VNFPKVYNELIGVLVTLTGRLCEALTDNEFEFHWDTGTEAGDGVRVAVQDGLQKSILVFRIERPLAGEHLVEQNSQGPDIGSLIGRFTPGLLG
jgi:hypothetical protein